MQCLAAPMHKAEPMQTPQGVPMYIHMHALACLVPVLEVVQGSRVGLRPLNPAATLSRPDHNTARPQQQLKHPGAKTSQEKELQEVWQLWCHANCMCAALLQSQDRNAGRWLIYAAIVHTRQTCRMHSAEISQDNTLQAHTACIAKAQRQGFSCSVSYTTVVGITRCDYVQVGNSVRLPPHMHRGLKMHRPKKMSTLQ